MSRSTEEPATAKPFGALSPSFRVEADERSLLEALAKRPDDARLMLRLGVAKFAAGKRGEGLKLIEQAVRRDPSAEALDYLGQALAAAGRPDLALRSFERAIERDDQRISAHFNAAACADQLGEPDRAIAGYRRTLKLDPKLDEAALRLASLLSQAGGEDEAEALYEQILARDASNPHAACGLAVRLIYRGEVDRAIHLLGDLLQSSPAHGPALRAMGTAHEHAGRQAEAASYYRQAIAADPADAQSLSRLLGLHDEVQPRDVAAALRLADDSALDGELRSRLHRALARRHDKLRAFDAAFRHLSAACAAKPARSTFEASQTAKEFARIEHVFSPALVSHDAGRREGGRYIFVVGMPRSGTTLTERILARHPRVHGAGELEFFPRLALGLRAGARPELRYPECAAYLSTPELEAIAEDYAAELQGVGNPDQRIIDKMPLNFLHLGLIRTVFPEATIVHVRRNPADVCLSNIIEDVKLGEDINSDLATLPAYYRAYHRLMEHWTDVLDRPMIEVRYEDLVGSPEEAMRRLYDGCGLEWNEAALSFHEDETVVLTPSNLQVRQPIYASSRERWRNYETQLAGMVAELADLMPPPSDAPLSA